MNHIRFIEYVKDWYYNHSELTIILNDDEQIILQCDGKLYDGDFFEIGYCTGLSYDDKFFCWVVQNLFGCGDLRIKYSDIKDVYTTVGMLYPEDNKSIKDYLQI